MAVERKYGNDGLGYRLVDDRGVARRPPVWLLLLALQSAPAPAAGADSSWEFTSQAILQIHQGCATLESVKEHQLGIQPDLAEALHTTCSIVKELMASNGVPRTKERPYSSPTNAELDAFYTRVSHIHYLHDMKSVSDEEVDLLHRCYHLVATPSLRAESSHLASDCRVLLLFVYGTFAYTDELLAKIPSRAECKKWAMFSFPDRSIDDPLLWKSLGYEARKNSFLPPVLRRTGGVLLDVGADVQKSWPLSVIGRPHHIHVFEATAQFVPGIQERWAGRPNVTVHAFGLGATSFVGSTVLAAQSTSLYHQILVSGTRVYLDSIGDPASGRQRATVTEVNVRSIAEAWEELKLNNVAVLMMNCEGCEYDVIEDLAKHGLLPRIETIQLETHLVLKDSEVEPGCDRETGTCQNEGIMPAFARYCELVEALEPTHRRVLGLPFHRGERWQRLPRSQRI